LSELATPTAEWGSDAHDDPLQRAMTARSRRLPSVGTNVPTARHEVADAHDTPVIAPTPKICGLDQVEPFRDIPTPS
jgi:hypothetical protein